ncbi:hypothetical protein GCM10007938_24960 [Vibrio zhanjiangensis]|uniref:Uncharacterized protein n=1 Tax=Vibrio zhanjiangensis TaxID=1046128 RepID=A0ABQ6EZN9_9VIBR|nr:hypothetical protein [Vibrio zhanjiangensis]GLT18715.1 hypothetical protein GCM10007938_24960 [Vibrio zhanjiangensis]
MSFDAMSVIQSYLEHREGDRIPFNTQEFVDWCQEIEGVNRSLTLSEANEMLKLLNDSHDQIELTHSYFPANNLGWFYYH